MKTIFKFFAVFAGIFLITQMPYQSDPVVAYTGAVIVANAAMASIMPPQYWMSGNLFSVTLVSIFNKYIIEVLRKSNVFMNFSRDESGYVLGGATVYIPNAGSDPTITLNNTTWPLTAAQRTDNDVNYALDNLSTSAVHLAWDEIQAIAYNKEASIINAHIKALADKVGDKMLINWAPTISGKQIACTGGSGAGTETLVTGQTGSRLGFDQGDLIKAMVAFNAANVPAEGRKCLIDANMYNFFYNSLTATQFNSFHQFANNQTGMVGKLHSFDIYVRSSVLIYATGSATCKAFGSSIAATDNLASLCWHEDMVTRALGDTKLFAQKDNPLYQGDLYSAYVRFGGRKVRYDNNGVIAIVQA